MPAPPKHKRIDELAAKMAEALERQSIFEAERIGEKALLLARQDEQFHQMAELVDPLLQARLTRMDLAFKAGSIATLSAPYSESVKLKRGCYLVQPPQVGSEARRLRLAALEQEVAVVVLCREPLTRAGLTPVVAISPGSTIRAHVPSPANAAKPDLVWFAAALEELGDWAIDDIDPSKPPVRRIDALLDCIDALPEHRNLHLALKAACEEACRHQDNAARPKATPKTKLKS